MSIIELLEKELTEKKEGLEVYLSGEYDDYKSGDPVEAAGIYTKLLRDIKSTIEKTDKLSGDSLRYGVRAAFIKDLKKLLKTFKFTNIV